MKRHRKTTWGQRPRTPYTTLRAQTIPDKKKKADRDACDDNQDEDE